MHMVSKNYPTGCLFITKEIRSLQGKHRLHQVTEISQPKDPEAEKHRRDRQTSERKQGAGGGRSTKGLVVCI